MIWNSELHALIPRNPLVERDLLYQQRTTGHSIAFIETAGIVAAGIGFAAAMFYYFVHHLYPSPHWTQYHDGIQILAWIFHAAVALRLITAGARSTAWSRSILKSDELTLTSLSNRQLLIARWWGAMHQVRGWMLALGIVQVGIVFSAALGTMMHFGYVMDCIGPSCIYTIGELSQTDISSPARLLPIAASVIAIPILETMCCTALGMVCAIGLGNRFGLIAAIALRFVPVFIFSFVPDYLGPSTDFMFRFAEYNWFSFADGGTGTALQLALSFDESWTEFQRGKVALFAIAAMFVIYLIGSLAAAWALMRRSRR
ncbi:MAG: hypothetical protein ABI690_32680 [Chloroflexota bacterium]